MRWYVHQRWDTHTARGIETKSLSSAQTSYYLFIELLAIFQKCTERDSEKKKCAETYHWHHDITFDSLNCVCTHIVFNLDDRQVHSFHSFNSSFGCFLLDFVHTCEKVETKQEKNDMRIVHGSAKSSHVNHVQQKTSSGAIKVILCFHFWLCISYMSESQSQSHFDARLVAQ